MKRTREVSRDCEHSAVERHQLCECRARWSSRKMFRASAEVSVGGWAGDVRAVAVQEEGAGLFVGTSDGSLLEVRRAGEASLSVSAYVHISKHAVLSLRLLPTTSALLALTEEPAVRIVDLDSLSSSSLPWIRSVFALSSAFDSPNSHFSAAALTHRGILTLSVTRSSSHLSASSHGASPIALPEPALSAVLLLHTMIVATRSAFYLITFPSRSVSQLFSLPPDSRTTPSVASLPGRNEALLVFDNLCIHVDSFGHPLGGTVPCNAASAHSIAPAHPYILTYEEGSLHVYHIESGDCTQSIALEAPNTSTSGVGGVACDTAGHYGAVFMKNQVWFLTHVLPSTRAQELHRCALLRVWEVLSVWLSDSALSLYMCSAGNLHGALQLAKSCEGGQWKESLLQSIGQALFERADYEGAVDCLTICESLTVSHLLTLVPSLYAPLAPLCAEQRVDAEDENEHNAGSIGNSSPTDATHASKHDSAQLPAGNDADRMDAAARIVLSMVEKFHDLSKEKEQQYCSSLSALVTAECLLLSWCNRLVDLERVCAEHGSLCSEIALQTLDDGSHEYCRAVIQYGRQEWIYALSLFQRVAAGSVIDVALVTSGMEPFHACSAYISKMAEQSDNDDIASNALYWLLDNNCRAAFSTLKCLVAEEKMSVYSAIGYLETHAPHQVLPFLEHAIWELEDSDTRIHIRFATELIDRLESEPVAYSPSLGLKDDWAYEPAHRRNLLQHLRNSRHVDATKVLQRLQSTGLQLEHVLALRRLNRHEEALDRMVRQLGDLDSAEEYCLDMTGSMSMHEALNHLLWLLVEQAGGETGRSLKFASRLLGAYRLKVDPQILVGKMKDTETLADSLPMLQHLFRDRSSRLRGSQIERGISTVAAFSVLEAVDARQQRCVTLVQGQICARCKEVLFTSSASEVRPTALLSDGSVVCFRCADELRHHPQQKSLSVRCERRLDDLYRSLLSPWIARGSEHD